MPTPVFNLESQICEVKDLVSVLAEYLRESQTSEAEERLGTSITLSGVLDDKAKELFNGYYASLEEKRK